MIGWGLALCLSVVCAYQVRLLILKDKELEQSDKAINHFRELYKTSKENLEQENRDLKKTLKELEKRAEKNFWLWR